MKFALYFFAVLSFAGKIYIYIYSSLLSTACAYVYQLLLLLLDDDVACKRVGVVRFYVSIVYLLSFRSE